MHIDQGAVSESTPSLLFTSASSPHSRIQHGDPRRLIFVTNRGPVEHSFGPDGKPVAKRGAGGVVSGLLCAAQQRPVSWISVAMTDADRALTEAEGQAVVEAPAGMANLTARLVHIPAETYRRYYDAVSNRLLWFAQHGVLRSRVAAAAHARHNWDEGYVAVNAALAEAVVAELRERGEDTPVMLHDYHLYLAPAMVRERVPDARLQHFLHIPWPTVEDWADVPDDVMREIYTGLAAADVLGFQTPRDARNFLDGAERYLPEARFSRDPDELYYEGQRTVIRAYPIALTPSLVREQAGAPQALEQVEQLRERFHLDDGRKLIVRVDRIEPTKNIARGFQAYERLLCEHPEWRERVTFLALLVPSRESLAEYRAYAERVRQAIDRVNARFGTPTWQPIAAIFGNDRARALACMRHYDVLLVNSLADGMNLVVKEGGLLNERNGVIVLSERAGAYSQLRGGVLGIAPEDVSATTQALYTALTLPEPRRAELAARVRATLEAESAGQWLGAQLKDLMRVTGLPPAMSVREVVAQMEEPVATAEDLPLALTPRYDPRREAAHGMARLAQPARPVSRALFRARLDEKDDDVPVLHGGDFEPESLAGAG